MSVGSFYWYDYETFGADPRRDRPAQFAGLRTDTDLNPIGVPLVLYCRPPPDYLPAPEACLLTGITPQKALREGVPEAEFIAAIHAEFSVPGTCVVGYNNLRFDDEITRHCLYRNLLDPYAREWRNGNSRWDLIDLARLARALRPEGIQWPVDETGRPSLRLELLTAANGIAHTDAHDALSDVQATIALARLFRARQPRLYQFLLDHRGKQQAAQLLGLGTWQPVLHASEKISTDRHCLAVVVALAPHPRNPNGVVTYDLAYDPTPLLTLDAATLRERLFTPVADLPEGVERLHLKTVHLNRCPALAPLKVLRPQDIDRLGLDLPRCYAHLERLRQAPEVAAKIGEILDRPAAGASDPDLMLYDGGFFSDRDRAEMLRLRRLAPTELSRAEPNFEDPRLEELWFRYRARNYPESLSAEEAARWERQRIQRLTAPDPGSRGRDEYVSALKQWQAVPHLSPREQAIIDDLWAYLAMLLPTDSQPPAR